MPESKVLDELTSTGPSLLLDTARVQRKYDERNVSPYRIKTGVFTVPYDMTGPILERHIKERTETFINAMAKSGWTLQARGRETAIRLLGPEPALDNSGIPDLASVQYRVRGLFATVPKPKRIEIDPARIKQDQDHVATADDNEAVADILRQS